MPNLFYTYSNNKSNSYFCCKNCKLKLISKKSNPSETEVTYVGNIDNLGTCRIKFYPETTSEIDDDTGETVLLHFIFVEIVTQDDPDTPHTFYTQFSDEESINLNIRSSYLFLNLSSETEDFSPGKQYLHIIKTDNTSSSFPYGLDCLCNEKISLDESGYHHTNLVDEEPVSNLFVNNSQSQKSINTIIPSIQGNDINKLSFEHEGCIMISPIGINPQLNVPSIPVMVGVLNKESYYETIQIPDFFKDIVNDLEYNTKFCVTIKIFRKHRKFCSNAFSYIFPEIELIKHISFVSTLVNNIPFSIFSSSTIDFFNFNSSTINMSVTLQDVQINNTFNIFGKNIPIQFPSRPTSITFTGKRSASGSYVLEASLPRQKSSETITISKNGFTVIINFSVLLIPILGLSYGNGEMSLILGFEKMEIECGMSIKLDVSERVSIKHIGTRTFHIKKNLLQGRNISASLPCIIAEIPVPIG